LPSAPCEGSYGAGATGAFSFFASKSISWSRVRRKAGGMNISLEARLKEISELVSESSLVELTEFVWKHDRTFTFPAFQNTARHVSARIREWGVRARTFEIPADGKTLMGDWKMPLGWNCKSATLEIYDPFEERGRVLADWKKRPCHVVMWSGPTPPEGITATVIKIADKAELSAKKEQIKGKIVHTTSNPRELKMGLIEAGALAVVTSWCRNAHHNSDAVFWVNAWSDDADGWAFHQGDSPFPAMVITPADGVELDVLMDRGPVKLRMKIDTEYMESTLPLVCGYLDAPLQEEILAIGHAMEQGANDNASGCAVILESLRVLHDATQKGALPPLRRAVRGLLTNECYGTMGFAVQYPGILRRALAGINWDSLGRHHEDVDAVFKHHRCPDASASVADTLMLLLLETWLKQACPYARLQKDLPFSLTDNHYCDPQIGIHCVYVDGQDRWWHTSRDTMDKISGRSLHAFATISVAYLHFLSTATAVEALWLAQQTVRRFGKRMEDVAGQYAVELEAPHADKPAVLARAFDHLAYVFETCDRAVLSAKRFMLREERAQGHLNLKKLLRHPRRLLDLQKRRLKELADCDAGMLPEPAGLAELAEWRPFKKFVGTATYDSVPAEKKGDLPSPMWMASVQCALFWADGKPTFKEIVRRVGYEFENLCEKSLVSHFRFMGEQGLLQWLKPGDPIPKPEKHASKTDVEDEAAPADDPTDTAEAQAVPEPDTDEAPAGAAVE